MRSGHAIFPLRPILAASLAAFALIILPGCNVSGDHHSDTDHNNTDSASATVPEEKDPAALILAEHDEIDAELRNADLSPFTASAAHYVDSGKAGLVGAGPDGVKLNPAETMPAMATITFEEDAFWIAPVKGAGAPRLHERDDDGNPVRPGNTVTEKTMMKEGEVLGLGSFLLSMSPQSGMFRIMVYDPESPERRAFTGLKWFAPNPELQVKGDYTPFTEPQKVTVATSRGLEKSFHKAGKFSFRIDGKTQTLVALAASADPEPGDELFMPFTDLTSGKESYNVGRYLSVAYMGPGKDHLLDFNRAGSPNCDYSPLYNCPFPPRENALTVAVNAGERKYSDHH